MRVAIVGASNFDTIEYNFWETFTYLGHTAKIFDDKEIISICGSKSRALVRLLSNGSYSFARWAYKKLANKILKYEPDLVIVTYRHVIPEFVRIIKYNCKKIPVIHVNPDHVGTLGRQYILMSPYDAYFTKDQYWVNTLKDKLCLNAFYLPESFNPRIHIKPDSSKEECENKMNVDIAIVATLYPYRVKFLESLLKILPKDIKIAILGNKVSWLPTKLWDYHSGKCAYGLDKGRIFYGAKVVLNNIHYNEYNGVNCRFFEVLGCGGFQLCDDKSCLPELAMPDKEVVTFRDLKECAKKVIHYLSCPQERYAIASAGYERAIEEHTYEKRIDTILSKLSAN